MSEIKTSAKHVVIFGGRPSDGGSIPPASSTSKLLIFLFASSRDSPLPFPTRKALLIYNTLSFSLHIYKIYKVWGDEVSVELQ